MEEDKANMVLDTVNVCMQCDCEFVGRDEVEAIVAGKSRVVLSREHMRWDTYMSSHAFIYESFMGKTGARGKTKNIVCGCNVERSDVSPSMLMIRKEFREVFSDKLGDVLTLPFLFQLPTSVVAWENSAFVCVQQSEGRLVLSDTGLALIDIIADMSKLGEYVGGQSKYTQDQVLGNFSYLYMVQPKYRSFVAMDFGPKTTMSRLFATLPLEWVDWSEFPLLYCKDTDGGVELSRVAGMPLVAHATRFFREGNAKRDKSCLTTVDAVRRTLCMQFMPASLDTSGRDVFVTDTVSDVVLQAGQSFIPSGCLRISADRLAVTFEPGVEIRTNRDTVVKSDLASVTIFINGSVQLEVSARGRKKPVVNHLSCYDGYQVAVVANSYHPSTDLGRWYARRFDVLSTDARFFSPRAEFVVLHTTSVHRVGIGVVKEKFIVSPGVDDHGDDDGTVVRRCVGGVGHSDIGGETVNTGPAIIRRVCGDGESAVIFANAILMRQDSVVASLVPMRFALGTGVFDKESNWRDSSSVSFDLVEVLDDYVIDGGGPSDSEGYFDETDTPASTKPESVLRWRYIHNQSLPTYSRVVKHLGTAAHHLGVHPTFAELARCPGHLINRDALRDTGWRQICGRWFIVVGGPYDMSWFQFMQYARTWELPIIASSWEVGKSLLTILIDMFNGGKDGITLYTPFD